MVMMMMMMMMMVMMMMMMMIDYNDSNEIQNLKLETKKLIILLDDYEKIKTTKRNS